MAIPGLDRAAALITEVGRRAEDDKDETRRLCYMLLVASKTERGELVATLINAFMHHGHVKDCDETEATTHLVRLANDEDHDGTSAVWLRDCMENYLKP